MRLRNANVPTGDVVGGPVASPLQAHVDEHDAHGATLLEVSLVCGLFVLLVFALLDFGRYMATRAILMKAVQNTLNYSQKVASFEVDIRGLTSSDSRYLGLIAARRSISNYAQQFPSATFVGNILDEFRIYDESGGPPVLYPPSGVAGYSALVLRPGEVGRRTNRSGVDIQHPTLCGAHAPCPRGRPQLQASDGWAQVIRDHPIYVEMSAQVDMIIPLWGAGLTVRSSALGFRLPCGTVRQRSLNSCSPWRRRSSSRRCSERKSAIRLRGKR